MKILIITGMSGAGKSQTTKFLEDFGYFCIDNLPLQLLPKFSELYNKNEITLEKMACVIDIRNGEFYNELIKFKSNLSASGIKVELLFLDCSDEVLLYRYKQNRRMHPLVENGNNLEGIAKERKYMEQVRLHSDYIIDTTDLTPWKLKNELLDLFVTDRKNTGIKINIISFGYKHGLPSACDNIFDVRFIPNPYYVPELRFKNGNDEEVRKYVIEKDETKIFFDKLYEFSKAMFPFYQSEGKEILYIGIGCTGGKHRSVAVANELETLYSSMGYSVFVEHRDIDK